MAPLIDALGWGSREERDVIARALTTLTKEDFGADQARWQAWFSAREGR